MVAYQNKYSKRNTKYHDKTPQPAIVGEAKVGKAGVGREKTAYQNKYSEQSTEYQSKY